MQSEIKKASDCDAFCDEYILKRKDNIKSSEEYAFLLGYYSHLITDAAFHAMIRDDERVKAIWKRIKADEGLRISSADMDETWDSVKKLIPKQDGCARSTQWKQSTFMNIRTLAISPRFFL